MKMMKYACIIALPLATLSAVQPAIAQKPCNFSGPVGVAWSGPKSDWLGRVILRKSGAAILYANHRKTSIQANGLAFKSPNKHPFGIQIVLDKNDKLTAAQTILDLGPTVDKSGSIPIETWFYEAQFGTYGDIATLSQKTDRHMSLCAKECAYFVRNWMAPERKLDALKQVTSPFRIAIQDQRFKGKANIAVDMQTWPTALNDLVKTAKAARKLHKQGKCTAL